MRALTTTARLASSGANRGGVAGAAPPRYGHVANPLGLASVRASSSPLPRRAAALDLRAVEATVESVVDVEYAPAPAPTPAAAVVASVPSGRAGVNGLALAALAAFAALSLPEAAHASAASTDALAAFDIPGLVGDDPVREARAGPTAGDVDDPLPAGAPPPPPRVSPGSPSHSTGRDPSRLSSSISSSTASLPRTSRRPARPLPSLPSHSPEHSLPPPAPPGLRVGPPPDPVRRAWRQNILPRPPSRSAQPQGRRLCRHVRCPGRHDRDIRWLRRRPPRGRRGRSGGRIWGSGGGSLG